MTPKIWVEDQGANEYSGPESQAEVPVHYEEKRHGLDVGCLACKRAAVVARNPRAFFTSYVADGTRHEHAYVQTFDGEHE